MHLVAAFGNDPNRAAAVVRRMLAAQALPGSAGRVCLTSRGAVGLVTRPQRPDELTRFIADGPAGALVALIGMPIVVGGSIDEHLRRAATGEHATAVGVLSDLDGHFVALRWSPLERRIALVTDFLGMAPLFEASVDGWQLFASTERAIVASGLIGGEADPAGWGHFFGFRQPMAGDTKIAGVRRVDPAHVREMDENGRTLASRAHWEVPVPASKPRRIDEAVDGIARSITAMVDGYAPDSILLSGGFDSRVIANLLYEAGERPSALVQSHPDEQADADGIYAAAVARRLGFPCEFHTVDRDFSDSADYAQYLQLSDLALPSINLFIATTARLLGPSRQAVWTDTVVGPALKRRPAYGTPLAHIAKVMNPDVAQQRIGSLRVFGAAWREAMVEGVRAGLETELSRVPADPVGERVMRVWTRTRLRVGSHFYRVHDAITPSATPGMTRDTWAAALGLRQDAAIAQVEFIGLQQHRFARTVGIPFVSGGKMVAASPTAWPRHWWQLAEAGVQSTLRRPLPARVLAPILTRLGVRPAFTWGEPRAMREALTLAADSTDAAIDHDVVAAMLDGRVYPTRLEREALAYWYLQQQLQADARRAGDVADAWLLRQIGASTQRLFSL